MHITSARFDQQKYTAARAGGAPIILLAALLLAAPATAQDTVEMQHGMPNARLVPLYSPAERTRAVQELLKLASPPALNEPVALSPNAPYAPNGARLSFWKPSFVIGTANGGEAGVNFWGKFVEGHVNLGFTAKSEKPTVLDCRILSTGSAVGYKIYAGVEGSQRGHGEVALRDGHFLLAVPIVATAYPISVELWPSPNHAVLGFFGCDLDTIA